MPGLIAQDYDVKVSLLQTYCLMHLMFPVHAIAMNTVQSPITEKIEEHEFL